MNNQWVAVAGTIEEPSSDDDEQMSLHEHVFGEPEGPDWESMPPSPDRPTAGDPVTEENDSILDESIRSIPPNVDSTLSMLIGRRTNRRRTERGRRGDSSRRRERSRSRERTLNFQRQNNTRVHIDCPLCERSDVTVKTLEEYIIENCGKRNKSLSAICRLAWKRLVTKDLRSGANYESPSLEDVSHHALRCVSHPNIIVQEQADTWRGITQELTASAKIGTASSGATIYDPKFIGNYKVASEMLFKYVKVKAGDMEGFMAPTNVSNEKEDLTRVKEPLY